MQIQPPTFFKTSPNISPQFHFTLQNSFGKSSFHMKTKSSKGTLLSGETVLRNPNTQAMMRWVLILGFSFPYVTLWQTHISSLMVYFCSSGCFGNRADNQKVWKTSRSSNIFHTAVINGVMMVCFQLGNLKLDFFYHQNFWVPTLDRTFLNICS